MGGSIVTNESAILGLIAELYLRNTQLMQENQALAAEVQRLRPADVPTGGVPSDSAHTATN